MHSTDECVCRLRISDMNKRYFTPGQLKYIYSDIDFFGFVNQYFSSCMPTSAATALSYAQNWDDKLKKAEKELLLRVTLANISKLRSIVVRIERNLSYNYQNNNVDIKGEIKGTLRVNEYFKRKGMQQTPKLFPCVVKQRTHNTPENIFFIFAIRKVIKQIKYYQSFIRTLGETKSSESQLLDEHLKYFMSITKKAYYYDCVEIVNGIMQKYNNNFPYELQNMFELRLRKRQMLNVESYKALWKWYITFCKYSLSFSGEAIAETLIYNEEFSDKLFELWLLHGIEKVFINDYKFEKLDQNHLKDRHDSYIFKVKTNNDKLIEIYFQRGKDLFWDNTTRSKWKYKRSTEDEPLIAIPDIIIKYNENKLVLVDAKNRIRVQRQNSDEIYKMLGYYENFSEYINRKYGKSFRYNSALLFRNDSFAFKEKVHTDYGDEMLALSFSPQDDYQLNKYQFRELCRFILEVCGNEGNTAEVIGEHKNNVESIKEELVKAIAANDETTIELIIKQISDHNHNVIEGLFNAPELEEQIVKTAENLKKNHFPHIWNKMHSSTKRILCMAEYLYNTVGSAISADYAPICLEFCRALEVELNNTIFTPFRSFINVNQLANSNWNYRALNENRDLTMGECVFILQKCKPSISHATIELINYIQSNIKAHVNVLTKLKDSALLINTNFRRNAAHTHIMNYASLTECREYILGIGRERLFYFLLDDR